MERHPMSHRSLRAAAAATAAAAALLAGCSTMAPGGAPSASGPAASGASAGSPGGAASASVEPSDGLDTPGTGELDPSGWPSAFPSAFATPSLGGIRIGPTGSGRLDGKTIVVDPGHNTGWIRAINNLRKPLYGTVGARCVAVGGTGLDKKTPEHLIVWKIGEKLVPLLTAQGATVLLTRPNDDGLGPCNDERAEIANRAGADFLISLHADGADNQKLRGWYLITAKQSPGGKALLDASHAAALAMIPGITAHTSIPPSNYAGTDGVPVETMDLAVLNNLTRTRGVLIEIGNIIQTDDWGVMSTDAGRLGLAEGVAAGVLDAVGA